MHHGMTFVLIPAAAHSLRGRRPMDCLELNEENFDREIQGHCGLAVVLCGMPWTGTTYIARGVIDNLIQGYGHRVKFGILDSLECPRLRIRYSLRDVTLLFFRDGKLADLRQGIISENDVRICIEALLTHGPATTENLGVTGNTTIETGNPTAKKSE
jgi:thioredoxin-like negative regulator of GroEL